MSSSVRNAGKGKPANPKPAAKKEGKAAFVEDGLGLGLDSSGEANGNQASGAIANPKNAQDFQSMLAHILTAIGELKEDMGTRFNSLDLKLHLVQTALADHATRITDLEGGTNDHETRIADLERRCEELTEANKTAKRKLIDLENRSRRSNIKITGLPEKAEKGNPTQFVAEFLPQLLGTSNFPGGLKLDRAHRIGAQPPSARPRTMIVKIHHFPEKEKILKLARLQSPLSLNGVRISIYPFFSPEVSEQRRAFDGAKKKLRDAGIKHGLLFPARLIFSHGTELKIFQKPADAEAFKDRFITTAAAP